MPYNIVGFKRLSISNFSRWKNNWSVWAATILLAGAVFAVYAPGMTYPFVFDDAPSVEQNQSILQLWPPFGETGRPGPLNPPKDLPTSGRPLVNLTLALNYRLGQFNPFGYHLFNLAVHSLCALTLGLIVRRILRLEYFDRRFVGFSGLIGFLAALLWAVHPLNSETVIYITQRTELMVGFFYLATLYCSLRYWAGFQSNQKTLWLILAALACSAGMACKEVMVTAPVVVLLFERTFVADSFRHALRKSWLLYTGLAISWLLLLGLNFNHPRSSSAGFDLNVTPLTWWITQANVLWRYFKLVIWPWPLSIHYSLHYLTFTTAWPWALATTAFVAVVLVLLQRKQALGYIGAGMLLILSPTFVVPIITEVMAERRMYLPLAALITAFVVAGYWLLQRIWNGRTAAAVITTTVITLVLTCGVLNAHRLMAYHDALTLWQDTATSQPDDSVAFNNWGLELTKVGRASEAIQRFQQALLLDPKHAEVRANLGTALMNIGHLQDAIDQFQEALKFNPNFVAARCNLGIALGKSGNTQAAVEQLQIAEKTDANNAVVHYNLGLGLAQIDQLPAAVEQFEAALRSNPNYTEARIKLAFALSDLARPQEAIEQFQQVLQAQADSEIYFNLALVYAQLNSSQEALANARKAVEWATVHGQIELIQELNAWLKDYEAGLSNHPELSLRPDLPPKNRQ